MFRKMHSIMLKHRSYANPKLLDRERISNIGCNLAIELKMALIGLSKTRR
jgi:hypothetical protein